MAKKETAEEKLLKIIEATQKAKGLAPSSAAVAIKAPRRVFSFSVRQVNFVLVVGLVAGCGFFVNEVRRGNLMLGQELGVTSGVTPASTGDDALLPAPKNIAYYLDKITVRNIFQPYDKKVEASDASAEKNDLQSRLSKYKLVGVAWLDVPESATVMIENTGKRETRFLKQGDKIEDIQVKTIYTDRVVFSYANEEMTIKL